MIFAKKKTWLVTHCQDTYRISTNDLVELIRARFDSYKTLWLLRLSADRVLGKNHPNGEVHRYYRPASRQTHNYTIPGFLNRSNMSSAIFLTKRTNITRVKGEVGVWQRRRTAPLPPHARAIPWDSAIAAVRPE
jgi:hypothetical protein